MQCSGTRHDAEGEQVQTRMKIFSTAVWMRSMGFCGRAGAGTKKRMRSPAWFIPFSAFFSPRRRTMLENSWLLAASQHRCALSACA